MINRNLPRALGALAILATAFAVIAAGAVPAIGAQLQHVLVKNDVSNPVPTAAQGVSQVAGTVRVDDTTPISVAVANAPEAATEETVQFTKIVLLEAELVGLVTRPLYDVPDGRRLIIDRVGANLIAPEGSDFMTSVGQSGDLVTLPLTPGQLVGSANSRRYFAAEPGPIYVDGVDGSADELIVRFFRDEAATNDVSQLISISGRLVDKP